MAGLPCDVCQEATTVLSAGCSGIVSDTADRVLFRRYRVCTNPECELYLFKRETFEVATPLAPDASLVSPEHANLRHLKLRPRTTPAPDWLGLPDGS